MIRTYLNSARFLKVGQSLWVDRNFSNSVLNGMYSFHASASAYTEYWNNSYATHTQITRRHIWQAFVQESLHSISSASDINLELKDALAIDDITKQAFEVLGQRGIITPASQHSCSECTQAYKNNQSNENLNIGTISSDLAVPVKMAVVDGIIVGPQHWSYDNYTAELLNACGGAFCALHESNYGSKCHMCNCLEQKITETQACRQHQGQWSKYTQLSYLCWC